METYEARAIKKINGERQQYAAACGWQFRDDAPELLTRWQVLPFNQIGDKRLAYGVLTGMYQNMPFTMFDFHRRPKVTHVVTRFTGKEVNQLDSITVDSVWAVTLPVTMPNFQIASSVESTFDVETCPEPATHDPKFNRWYKLISTDPNLAVQILTPPVMATMRKLKLHNWSLVGNELLYVAHPFTRTKPDDVVEVLGKLATLVSLLPMHLGQPAPGAPPVQQAPVQQPVQPQYPPPVQYQQPQYQQPQYQQPQYQPYPPQYQQPQYQQPQYGGYPQQPGYPPPGPYGPR
jgi:hypothetical protein